MTEKVQFEKINLDDIEEFIEDINTEGDDRRTLATIICSIISAISDGEDFCVVPYGKETVDRYVDPGLTFNGENSRCRIDWQALGA